MILHVDMDAFFAAVEQLTDPRLKGRPVLVCGDPGTRSVVAAASYEARPMGVHAGMPVGEAVRRCPQAVLVPGHPSKYVALSLRLLERFKRYAPRVEPTSIDEAYLDLAGTAHEARPREAAAALQGEVERDFSLTCSIGIGPNKLVAKMASGLVKPRGLTELSQADFQRVFGPRPVAELWGIGEKTAAALAPLGIRTIGDLAGADRGVLAAAFGVNGPRMMHAAHGDDRSPVQPYYEGVDNKSMGHEHTLSRDLTERAAVERLLLRLSDQVTRRMRSEGYVARVVVLKLRTPDFRTRTRQRALPEYTDEGRVFYAVARALLAENWRGEPLRLVGLSGAALERRGEREPGLLFDTDVLYRRMLRCADGVRDRFGEEALIPAAALP